MFYMSTQIKKRRWKNTKLIFQYVCVNWMECPSNICIDAVLSFWVFFWKCRKSKLAIFWQLEKSKVATVYDMSELFMYSEISVIRTNFKLNIQTNLVKKKKGFIRIKGFRWLCKIFYQKFCKILITISADRNKFLIW